MGKFLPNADLLGVRPSAGGSKARRPARRGDPTASHSSKRQLTRGTARDSQPSFSPDGCIVAFERRVPEDGTEIFLKALDGARPKQITDGPDRIETPVFSPDGKRIAFPNTEGVPAH